MAEFTVNPKRHDPYKNFKFQVKWDGKYVAGISKVTGLKRTTEVVKFRDGADPSSSRKSPGRNGSDATAFVADRKAGSAGNNPVSACDEIALVQK